MCEAKRKAVDDDFVFTISDNEADLAVEEVVEPAAAAPPKKKAKKDNKKSKKNKQQSATEDEEPVDEPAESIWGQKDEDDGAMDSEFEFIADDGAEEIAGDEFEGWGFDGARKGMNTLENKGVDLDEIIRRRREKRDGVPAAEEANGDAEEEKEDDDDGDFELDDDEDGVLAEDGFGMGVGSDVDEDEGEKEDDDDDEEDDEEEQEYEDGDEPASDDDSVATPVNHPEDDGHSDSDDDEDPEEAARREAFFAPEEKATPGSKKTNVTSFQSMSLSRPILRGLANVGFTKPTPIQSKAIPIALMGKDVVGGAATGSGKTGAFIVPIIERLLYRPKKVATTRVVILLPTRELAIQCHAVATKLASYTDIKFCLAVGGLSLKVQEAELRLRPDVVIATPGRFIDHMRNSPSFTVDTVEILVLDEADRMLEDGFADELNEILTSMPKSRQTMLFSATMTSTVDRLVRIGMNKPVRIMVDSQSKTVTTLVQEFVRLRPGREEKRMGYLRIESVENFRDGKVSFLLATDLASRGLDIKGVDTVINYEAPQSLDIYVHRVGRTARAGRSGVAVTLAAEPDRKVVKAAVRAGKSTGAKISSRVIDATEADKLQAQIDEMEDEIEEIMAEEKQEKEIAHVEMQVKKGENMIRHEEEIKARPKRTWFETEKDKKEAKLAGKTELNGVREQLKKKGHGQLSNKDKKKLDAKAAMSEGRAWKKEERLLDFHLDTLPYYKHGLQSRIYRWVINRERKRQRLSGVPPPTVGNQQQANPLTSVHEEHERKREEDKIAKEAADIEKKGQKEKEAANKGTYSERPREESDSETDSIYPPRTRSGTGSPISAPSSPVMAAKMSASSTGDLTEAELAVANANMMARLGPFLTVPLEESPVTLFFYNDTQSQSRTVITNDSGHFVTRVALDFVPTHVRVLAAESSLSVTEPIKLIEDRGVSLISDIDDTIKRSSISMGAREIFRNTFVRDLGDLTVDGVKEWYNSLHDMGVSIHYCSNSPWQLFPVIASFFHLAGLPPGSIHLKQYSGMLQGIFEPVAERKKGTLDRILRDFPERKFLLVGDSGEADLEVYTELAVANPGRILAVFIRDVTTPEPNKFFEESFGTATGPRGRVSRSQTSRTQVLDPPGRQDSDEPADRPALPPRLASAPSKPEENLIDLSDEPEEMAPNENQLKNNTSLKTSVSAVDLLARKQPPPRPAKPPSLRSSPSETGSSLLAKKSAKDDSTRPPLPGRKPSTPTPPPSHPLAQMQTLSSETVPNTSTTTSTYTSSKREPPPPPLPRRKGTGASSLRAVSPRTSLARRSTANSDFEFDPLPGPGYAQSISGGGSGSGANSPPAVSKKVDMWRRRLERAHATLDHIGVQLYTWRRGDDVIREAEGIVRRELEDVEKGRREGR
ncbi:hypothetical protein GE09DRAFT_1179365 [Coniochaeta sp. 2T2.1]|nr:hypothetical protein GE09DRAFT_1179365 [Coniochaeta sp. 2T2.1]